MKSNGQSGVLPRGYRLGKLGVRLLGSYLGYQAQNLLLGEGERKQRQARFQRQVSRRVRDRRHDRGSADKLPEPGKAVRVDRGRKRDFHFWFGLSGQASGGATCGVALSPDGCLWLCVSCV